ncbi:hypothetical protein E2562_038373 [Oryza meyeriana var. granulata]|uniref:Uncharacterized protein n=1 Tax=Oryza meyeriana var. granulata TaxID=110450 RepID=A0A6G1F299_9ORYZ|nr:hypothetical protein E2562_038373 [Oryza meyeriana var. granulata]
MRGRHSVIGSGGSEYRGRPVSDAGYVDHSAWNFTAVTATSGGSREDTTWMAGSELGEPVVGDGRSSPCTSGSRAPSAGYMH